MHHRDRLELAREVLPREPDGRLARLGVLTFHRCINYGSYWQARCLVEGLQSLGYSAVLLDHRDPRVARQEYACALQPLLPVRSDAQDRRRLAQKVRAFAGAQARLPLSAPFGLEAGPPDGEWDAIVVGSDEVWNPQHPWYGGARLFWGDGLGHARLIAYAVSSGCHDDALTPEQASALAQFDTVAVRDASTQALVQAATGHNPPLVLDPCLQFPPVQPSPLRRSPYALVYGHDFPAWAGPAARQWAGARGLKLLSIGYRNGFADEQWLEAGPQGFACAVAGAEAIITTMFHGSVFALNAGLPFAAIPSSYRARKVADLLALVGADRQSVARASQLSDALAARPDAKVAETIRALRERSHRTLRHALA